MSEPRDLSLEAVNELLDSLHVNQQDLLFSKEDVLDFPTISEHPILQKVCADLSELMKCERVEIWMFNEDKTMLKLEVSYERGNDGGPYLSNKILHKDQVPAYFEAIKDKRTLAINNAENNPIMDGIKSSLSEEYHKINAMLDASIILNSGIGGVVCCLSETEREWTAVDKHVVASVADTLAFIFDRINQKKVDNHIHDLAYKDKLTGLNNQYAFNEIVAGHLQKAPANERGIFMYFILDQFTDIQSVLGFDGSEQVLVEISQRLRIVFPSPAFIARIGFDHFVMYSPVHFTEEESALSFENIKNELREPMIINGLEVYITFSYGIAYFPDHVNTAKDGLQAAQVALENARQKMSRNAEGFFQPNMHTFMKESLLSEMNLRKGLDLDQFELFYQPQVTCDTGEITGFEALIRWNHPEKGLVLPGDFISLAESTGLITLIGKWVIKQAFSQLSAWKAEGKGHLTLSINLSPQHFLHEELPEYLTSWAEQTGVSPEMLILEITENMGLKDYELARGRIIELKERGFSISIDDFGTGHSAFVYLQHFPVHQIKIDRQFIQNLSTNPNAIKITKTIVQLGKMLGLHTIAEGVETAEEWEHLKSIGCDVIQGFYFSKPLPIDKINKIMEEAQGGKPIFLPE